MRRALASWTGVLLTLGITTAALADAWPSRPVRAVIPFGAGSATDVIPRIVFEQLTTSLGQPIIVENRAGAGGSIGTASVARAEPDGYTLLATSSSHTILPILYPNLPYDTAADLTGVSILGSVPNVMIISPSKGIKTIQEFVAAAKARPNSVSFASLGIGSGVHVSAERFRISAGYEAVHIPFRGGAEALTEVVAGRVDYYFCPISTALPFIREGSLIPLVVSGPRRASALPDVPTSLESGFPDSEYELWIGVFAPTKTPRSIVERLHTEINRALGSPAVRERFTTLGVEPVPLGPAQIDARVKTEIEAFRAFAAKAGLKPIENR